MDALADGLELFPAFPQSSTGSTGSPQDSSASGGVRCPHGPRERLPDKRARRCELPCNIFASSKPHTHVRQGDRVIDFLLHVLNNDESEKVQAIICMGFAKLMLSRMVTENRVCGTLLFFCLVRYSPFGLQVLSSLILVYLSPDTADNQELRQCLSYFFPVYCYSSPANQRRMQQVFPSIFEQLATAYRALDDDQEMVSPAQVGGMFVDWTDRQKAVSVLLFCFSPLFQN